MLTVNNLNYSYKKGRPVLKSIDLSIEPGITLLIGENGSGKSTLLRLLSQDLTSPVPVLWNGMELSRNDLKRNLAYLPQEFDIYPMLKVRELLEFVAAAKGVERAFVSARVEDAAEKLHITQYLENKVKTCSVGTRRRVGIAAALLRDSEIIILDEPTAGIDPKERAQFYEIIVNCFGEKTVLMATHILDDAEILANYILMISNGEITYNGPYHSFRHAIDHMTYQTEKRLSQEEKDVVKKCGGTLLRMAKRDNKDISRFVCPEPPSFCKAIQVEPTLEDIWEFFQGRQSDGEMGSQN